MRSQTATSFLLIRPTAFSYNLQTAATNIFQKTMLASAEELRSKALTEFDHFSSRLKKLEINVNVFEQIDADTPDAVFPNNWISFHDDGKVIIYPMLTENRRKERRSDIIQSLKERYLINEVIDLTYFESEGKYLEGTGSIVFDHISHLAYACISQRTDLDVLKKACKTLGYQLHIFHAIDKQMEIYHTNVMLHIGEGYAVLCAECIPDIKERKDLERILAFTGHELILISLSQMHAFAGNMLQVQNANSKRYTLLSATALRSLHFSQIDTIAKHSEIVSFDIPIIEKIGGGSIRCMIAEIFCKSKEIPS